MLNAVIQPLAHSPCITEKLKLVKQFKKTERKYFFNKLVYPSVALNVSEMCISVVILTLLTGILLKKKFLVYL